MGYFGMGPRIFFPPIFLGLAAGFATWLWPQSLVMRFAPTLAFRIAGFTLIAIGLALAMPANHAMQKAVRAGRLLTTGPFALTRNPMYFSYIFLIFPGVAVVTRAWLVFVTPLASLALFHVFIKREEASLADHFGSDYLEYKARVPALLPSFRNRAPDSPTNTNRSEP